MPDLSWNEKLVARAIVHGINRPLRYPTRSGIQIIPAGTPLTIKQAARIFSTHRHIERTAQTAEFREMLEAEMKAADLCEQAANLSAAIAIRDHIGDNSNDTKRARLAAIETIRRPVGPVEARIPNRSRPARLQIRQRMLGPA